MGASQRVHLVSWCVGTVVEVADGKTTKKSSKCKSPLPWGAVRIRWPQDAEFAEKESYVWSVLKPSDYLCEAEAPISWRYSKAQSSSSCGPSG